MGLAISKGLRFVSVAICIRILGDYSWGQVVSALAILGFMGLLVDHGLGGALLLYRINDRSADNRLLLLVVSYRLAVATLILVLLHATHYWVAPVDPLVRLYSPVLLLRACGLEWWFHRRELYQVTLYLTAARTIVFFGLVTLFISEGSTATTVLIMELLSEGVAVVIAVFAKTRLFAQEQSPVGKSSFRLSELLVFALPFFFMSFLNMIQGSSDVLLLRYFLGNKIVAEYDVGAKIGLLYFFLGVTVMQTLRPKLTKLYMSQDVARVGAVLRLASAMLLFLSGLFLIPSLYFPRQILTLLFDYDRDLSVFTFRWVSLWISSSFLAMLCADTLLSLGFRRKYMVGAIICAGVNLGVNLILIRHYPGQGAVLAKFAADACFALFAFTRLPRLVQDSMRMALGYQVGVVAALVAVYFLTTAVGYGWLGALCSFLMLVLVTIKSRLFSRDALALIRNN